jgi:D-amino-acid oxidase
MSFDFNRRDFLRGAAATSALLLAAPSRALATFNPQRHFAPVKVSRDRVIREVVGLRPYRAEGFRVEAERVGEKFFIHNYGHGGAGITLSWGTASLAIDFAQNFLNAQTSSSARALRLRRPRFAVLGCGVNGLSTARMLQRRFEGSVTIYAKELPPETTSNIAGGFWYPSTVYDQSKVSTKFTEQFQTACRTSNRAFQTLTGAEYGVRWIETLAIVSNEAEFNDPYPGGSTLYPQIENHRDPAFFFGFPYVQQFTSMLIEPSIYLNALLRDFYIAGGKLVVKEFRSRGELNRLPEQIILNCTGLGARDLFKDEKLEPVRGQLEVLLPQPEIDYCYLSGSSYMFPRRDGIILGGTFDHGDWSLEPDPEQATGILNAHAEIMKGLKQ